MTRRGWVAISALTLILVSTASAWYLALAPLAPTAPAWLARTREVCFGTTTDGLPHLGGWLLLIGEPIGMIAALLIGWGDAVGEGLSGLVRSPIGRLATVGAVGTVLDGGVAAAQRVVAVSETTFDPGSGYDAAALVRAGRMDRAAPALDLVDQYGRVARVGEYRGRTWVVGVAYAHCTTVCPAVVRDLREVRRRLGENAPPLVLITLDPWRDPPSRLSAIAAEWGLGPDERLVSGTVDQVEQVLSAWQVPRSRNPATGELIHPALAYVVSPAGHITHLVDGTLESTLLAIDELSRR